MHESNGQESLPHSRMKFYTYVHTYSNVREGIFSLSLLDFMAVGIQMNTSCLQSHSLSCSLAYVISRGSYNKCTRHSWSLGREGEEGGREYVCVKTE